MKKIIFIAMLCLFNQLYNPVTSAAEEQVIAGAGPSTKIVEKFVNQFSQLTAAAGYTFIVPPKSAKHAGGIRASDTYVFGRTGRPLNVQEKKMNKDEIFLARVPISFVTGTNVGVSSISLAQLEDIYLKKIRNWKELGSKDAPIILVGREPAEALFTVLKSDYAFFNNVQFDKVVGKDDVMVNFLNSPVGINALGFGAKPNLEGLHIINVKDFSSGVSLGLVYDKKNKNHPLVKAAIDFASSEQWRSSLKEEGLLPPK